MVSISLPSQLVTDHKVMVYSTTGSREGNSRIQYSLTLPLCAWISGIYSVVGLSSAVHLVINQQMFISTLNTICFCQIKHLEGPREKKSKLSPCPKAASKVRVKSSAASGGFYFIRAWLGWKTAPQQGKKSHCSFHLQAPLLLGRFALLCHFSQDLKTLIKDHLAGCPKSGIALITPTWHLRLGKNTSKK